MIRVLVSACLLGEKVRYNHADAAVDHPVLRRWQDEGRLVPFCPELAGGLGVPRPPAEIVGGDGDAVLQGRAVVRTNGALDVTAQFLRGAHEALDAARARGVRLAVLKDGSPSCGSGSIHDGSFRGVTRPGSGVTTALLTQHGIRVFSERELEQAAAFLERLDTGRDPQS